MTLSISCMQRSEMRIFSTEKWERKKNWMNSRWTRILQCHLMYEIARLGINWKFIIYSNYDLQQTTETLFFSFAKNSLSSFSHCLWLILSWSSLSSTARHIQSFISGQQYRILMLKLSVNHSDIIIIIGRVLLWNATEDFSSFVSTPAQIQLILIEFN